MEEQLLATDHARLDDINVWHADFATLFDILDRTPNDLARAITGLKIEEYIRLAGVVDQSDRYPKEAPNRLERICFDKRSYVVLETQKKLHHDRRGDACCHVARK
jgi:hypothetical protein